MSYFDEVYLKRMNKAGTNRQDRIKTRKENEFDRIYLQRTEYKSIILEVNDSSVAIECSLQPNKWNENSIISNLLVSTSLKPFRTGDILKIKNKIKDKERIDLWLILFVEKNLAEGYQLFKCICLDEKINITNEYGDTIESIPVKVVNASSQFVKDTFSLIGLGYRETNSNRSFITAENEVLKKGTYFRYKDRAYEIYGQDNLSIKRVTYVSVNEKLYKDEEPRSSEDIMVGEDENFFLNGV